MLRIKYLAFAGALGLVFLIAPESQAQHGRGGSHSHASSGRGGVHVSSAAVHHSSAAVHHSSAARPIVRSGSVFRGAGGAGFAGRNAFVQGNRNWYGRGWYGGRGYGWYGGRGYGWWPGYWGGGLFGAYYAPYYDYGYSPSYYDYPAYDYYGSNGVGGYIPGTSFYPPVDSARDYNPPSAVAVNTAHIEVFVPEPNARLWFDGTLMTTRGLTRDFDTPALQPGARYSYTVKASWMEQGETVSREVVVPLQAGQQLLVDFNHNPPLVRPL